MTCLALPDSEASARHGVLHILCDEDAENDTGDPILVESEAVDQDHGIFLVHDEPLGQGLRLELVKELGDVSDLVLLQEYLDCLIQSLSLLNMPSTCSCPPGPLVGKNNRKV